MAASPARVAADSKPSRRVLLRSVSIHRARQRHERGLHLDVTCVLVGHRTFTKRVMSSSLRSRRSMATSMPTRRCRQHLCGAHKGCPRGAEVLGSVGRTVDPAPLFTTDRPQVAPVFYACSQSLTRYLVDQIGIDNTVALFPAFKSATWEREVTAKAGRPVETLRSEWLKRIGLASP